MTNNMVMQANSDNKQLPQRIVNIDKYLRLIEKENKTKDEKEELYNFFTLKAVIQEDNMCKVIQEECYDTFMQYSRNMRKSFKKLNEYGNSNVEYNYMYAAGVFVGMQSALQKMVPTINELMIFEYEMSKYIYRMHYKEILKYIYDVSKATNKMLADAAGLASNAVVPILNNLVDVGCLIKEKVGKNAYYSLTSLGRHYIKKNMAFDIEEQKKTLDVVLTDINKEKYKNAIKLEISDYYKYSEV